LLAVAVAGMGGQVPVRVVTGQMSLAKTQVAAHRLKPYLLRHHQLLTR
jgi:hypothetical protein